MWGVGAESGAEVCAHASLDLLNVCPPACAERFYDPQAGEVLIDGVDIKKLQVGAAQQETNQGGTRCLRTHWGLTPLTSWRAQRNHAACLVERQNMLLLCQLFSLCQHLVLLLVIQRSHAACWLPLCVQLRWLRSQIGLVSQEPTLFATTISENIRLGKPGALRLLAGSSSLCWGTPAGWWEQVPVVVGTLWLARVPMPGRPGRSGCCGLSCGALRPKRALRGCPCIKQDAPWRRLWRRPSPPTPTTSSLACPGGEHAHGRLAASCQPAALAGALAAAQHHMRLLP